MNFLFTLMQAGGALIGPHAMGIIQDVEGAAFKFAPLALNASLASGSLPQSAYCKFLSLNLTIRLASASHGVVQV